MGTTIGGLPGVSAVAMATGFKERSCECGDSFASDFLRLGATAATDAAYTSGRSWRTYPERPRGAEAREGLSYGRWQAYRSLDNLLADNLIDKPLIPKVLAEPTAHWHTSFRVAIERDTAFEDKRSEVMQQARHGIPPENTPFVRTFRSVAVLDQLVQIAKVNEEISRLEASVSQITKREARAIGQRNLDDLKEMRDTMLGLTTNLHERKFIELKVERNMLLALNDMAREAHHEMSNGGADVPLRLRMHKGKLVLKPAVSKSRFQRNHTRARNDAARLALLLGYPAGKPVSLADIHARGFGRYEYSMVLSDAREPSMEQTLSWFGSRAAEIDRCKQTFQVVRAKLDAADGGRGLRMPPVAAHDDDRFDQCDCVDASPPQVVPRQAGVGSRGHSSQERLREDGRRSSTGVAPQASLLPDTTPSPTRREQFADRFIAARSGRAGRLSVILETQPLEQRAGMPGTPEMLETPEENALRTGARPKTRRPAMSDDDTPPPLPTTPPPDLV